jgi:hypothetical protein
MLQWRWYAAESSVARTGERLVRPWVIAFWEERCLPGAVRGPADRTAFARFTAARLRAGGWLLATGVGIGFVILASNAVVAWADGNFARWVADVVGWAGKIEEGVA